MEKPVIISIRGVQSLEPGEADLGTAGGRLSIRYALEVDSQPIGENSFEIQVTEPHLTAPAPGQ